MLNVSLYATLKYSAILIQQTVRWLNCIPPQQKYGIRVPKRFMNPLVLEEKIAALQLICVE